MNNVKNITGTPLTATALAILDKGYMALGMSGRSCVLFSYLLQQVVRLSPTQMKEMDLKMAFGATWCDAHYLEFDEKKEQMVFNHRRLGSDIICACQAKGRYTATTERCAGVWRDSDGQLVVNGGELWRPDGSTIEDRIHNGRVYPAIGDLGFDRDTPEATDDDVQATLGFLGTMKWRKALGAELLLGWIVMSMIAGALDRRPHMLLVGSAGIGKSYILEFVKWLLGKQAFVCTGPQTMAGLYQSLGGNSRAVVHDELEPDGKRKGFEDVMQASRLSYSMQEGDEGLVRGSVTGVAKSYAFQSAFLGAGISAGKMEPADLSRWVVMEALGRKSDASRMTEAQAREIGPRLARRFINRWSEFQVSESVVREYIIQSGGTSRIADTAGTLLASYWTLVSNTPATADDAAVLVEMLDIESRKEIHAVSDERRCLEALLSNVQPYRFMVGNTMVTRSLSVGEAVKKYCESPTENVELSNRLAQLGLRAVQSKGVWRLYVVNSPEHRELRKLFSGTKWVSGGWSLVLRRLPGGEESTQRLGAGFPASKVTAFNIPAELLPEEPEAEWPMAA